MFELHDHAHTGRETVRRVYSIRDLGDTIDVLADSYSTYKIRPDILVLEWTRDLGQGWKRSRGFQRGSRISGGRVLKNGVSEKFRADVDVWTYHPGAVGSDPVTDGRETGLTAYAASVPGLALQILVDEKRLPGMDNELSN